MPEKLIELFAVRYLESKVLLEEIPVPIRDAVLAMAEKLKEQEVTEE